MINFVNASKLHPCLWLVWTISRDFWIATDLRTGAVYGRFNGEWWVA
jgi:hypothetical protein